MSCTVSWLLPVKNGLPYLPEALASLEAQTYRDFEVLAWDNGSTDGTLEELKRWIPHRLPGRIVTGQPRGVGGALAGLVEISQAEFCARMDADDIALPERLHIQVDYLRAHPEISLAGGQVKLIDHQGREFGDQTGYPLTQEDILIWMLAQNSFWHPTVVFRRQAILEAGNYRELPNVEDYELWLRLLSRHRVANLPNVLLHYRLHERSCTLQAQRANLLQAKADAVFVQHAEILFGWNEEFAKKFRTKQIPFMLPVALQLGRRFAGAAQSPLCLLRSPYAIDALLSQSKISDIISRLFLMALDRRPLYPVKRFRRLLKRIIG